MFHWECHTLQLWYCSSGCCFRGNVSSCSSNIELDSGKIRSVFYNSVSSLKFSIGMCAFHRCFPYGYLAQELRQQCRLECQLEVSSSFFGNNSHPVVSMHNPHHHLEIRESGYTRQRFPVQETQRVKARRSSILWQGNINTQNSQHPHYDIQISA